MTLIEHGEDNLIYRCLKKHEEHNFRYRISEKKWEKLIIKTKLVIHYNNDPCENGSVIEATNVNQELEKILLDSVQNSESRPNLTEINGIGSKRAEELEYAGVKTISDLAKCSPQQLAEATGIPITQISNWIIEADNLTKKAIKLAP